MDSNSIESKTSSEMSSVDKEVNESNNKTNEETNGIQTIGSEVKPEAKEVKYKKVESRYKQSTQQWVNKRAEDSNQSHNLSQGTSSRSTSSRNPTPERKKKASTPKTSDKTLNCTGVSAINAVNENKDNASKPEVNLKKYGKGLITGRKSIAPKRLPFDSEPKSGPLTTSGIEFQNRNKEFEESIKRSIYLQTLFLNMRAKVAQKERNTDAFNKIGSIWKQSNEIRDQLSETQIYINSLKNLIENIDILENQKRHLEEYLSIRLKMDPLFNRLSELIVSQKKILKIENCSEEDFNQLNELLESCPHSERLESAKKSLKSVTNIEELVIEIKMMETELEEYRIAFDRCVKELEKYDRIEKEINPEKALTLPKLF